MPDGDNKQSINIYKDTLVTLVHTRNDFPDKADIITLVEYLKGIYFSKAIYWICELCGYDYYENDKREIIEDPCLLFVNEVEPKNEDYYNEERLIKYPESILLEFIQNPHQEFIRDGISSKVQKEFEIAYSVQDHAIVIPIRDELGSLVGVKARTLKDYEKLDIPKYWYIYPTAKNEILYGLYKSYDYIMKEKEVIVFESEKSVQQAWSFGVKNAVAIGGKKLSDTQVLKLERLGVNIVIAYDKGFDKGKNPTDIKEEINKFLMRDRVMFIYDRDDLLSDKQSPTDSGKEVWKELYKKYRFKSK